MTRIERRVLHWQRRLGLTEWVIHVEVNSDPAWAEKLCANIAPYPGRKEAILTISSLHESQAALEHTIVHELTHLLLEPVAALFESWRKSIPAQVRATYTEQGEETLEQVVDALARVYVAEPPVRVKV